jgi:hypothetical protein
MRVHSRVSMVGLLLVLVLAVAACTAPVVQPAADTGAPVQADHSND